MALLQTASDTFLRVCSAIALTVTAITEWTAYVLHVNFVFVTNVYAAVCYTVTVTLTVLDYILQAVFTILVYVFDFLAEIYACICALLVLMWRICVLVYKLFCLLFTGIETVVLGLWNGGVLTYKTLQQSAIDVVETCESTSDYIAMLAHDFVTYMCGIFTTVGSFATWIVRCVWVGIGYIPATIAYIPSCIADWMAKMWMRFTMWVSMAFLGVTRETYIGICICCLTYVIISRLVILLHRRGLTLFPLWRHRHHTHRARRTGDMALAMVFDRGFESDIDDMDDIALGDSTGSEGGDTDGGEDSDTQTELTLSNDESDDDNSPGSESDVSLNSQTFTSEESDHEIDVQLPTHGGDNSRNSRSSTPSRKVPKDMNPDDFERELERERDKRKCVVCQDANKSVLILPCRHMCLCVACANQIVRSAWVGRRICPLCRTRIERVIDVYV